MSQKIEEILAELGPAYIGWKENEKKKDKLKKEFFETATEELQGETLAKKTVKLPGPTEDEATELCKKKYPGWIIDQVILSPDTDLEGWFRFTLSEDPALQPYTAEYEGVEFSRQIVSGSVFVDDERLKKEDPELWDEITFIPPPPPPKRRLRVIEELEPELQAKVQEYMYEGPPTVKFPAPKVVKE